MVSVLASTDRNGDADANLDPEDVVGRSSKSGILADVAFQVQVVDSREISQQMLSHAVERDLVDEAVVCHEAYNTVAPL